MDLFGGVGELGPGGGWRDPKPVEDVLAIEHRHRTRVLRHRVDRTAVAELAPRAFWELRLMRVCPLADVGESVQLTEALKVLEFDLDDIGEATARLQSRAD